MRIPLKLFHQVASFKQPCDSILSDDISTKKWQNWLKLTNFDEDQESYDF